MRRNETPLTMPDADIRRERDLPRDADMSHDDDMPRDSDVPKRQGDILGLGGSEVPKTADDPSAADRGRDDAAQSRAQPRSG